MVEKRCFFENRIYYGKNLIFALKFWSYEETDETYFRAVSGYPALQFMCFVKVKGDA